MSAPAHRLPPASLLFPWRAWVHHPRLRAASTWVFVALVAVPPLAMTLSDGRGHGPTVTVFAFYFAAAWALVLWWVVRPRHLPPSLLAQVAVLALVVEFPLAFALEVALDAHTENLAAGILTVGVPEELAKLLPVAVLALVRRRLFGSLAPRDVMYLGVVSGLVFGAVEAVHYAVDVMDVSTTGDGLLLVWRLLTDPVAHACWAGVSGWFLGLATRYREPGPWTALAAIGIGVPAVLHGLNDLVADGRSVAWVLVTVVSALLFLGYARVGMVAAPPARPVPDPPTMPIPVVSRDAYDVTAAAARPNVGPWTPIPTPRSATPRSWPPSSDRPRSPR